MRHDDAIEFLGAYALDAVPEEEIAALEAHLGVCEDCRTELDRHRETAAMLAQSDLWASLDDPPNVVSLAGAPKRGRGSRAARRLPRRTALFAGAAAALVIIVLASALVYQTRELDQARQTEPTTDDRELALRLADEPGSQRVALSSPDDQVLAAAVVAPDGRAFLVDDTLPQLPEGKTYQLWAVLDATRVSLGLLGRDPGVAGFRVPEGATWIAITAEDQPGVERSAMDPVVLGAV